MYAVDDRPLATGYNDRVYGLDDRVWSTAPREEEMRGIDATRVRKVNGGVCAISVAVVDVVDMMSEPPESRSLYITFKHQACDSSRLSKSGHYLHWLCAATAQGEREFCICIPQQASIHYTPDFRGGWLELLGVNVGGEVVGSSVPQHRVITCPLSFNDCFDGIRNLDFP